MRDRSFQSLVNEKWRALRFARVGDEDEVQGREMKWNLCPEVDYFRMDDTFRAAVG
jgi:hypothetical protein